MAAAEPVARRTPAVRARRDRERISLRVCSTAEKSEGERRRAQESRTNTAYFHGILDGIENEPLRWSGLLTTMGVMLEAAFYRYLPRAERLLNDIVLSVTICGVLVHLAPPLSVCNKVDLLVGVAQFAVRTRLSDVALPFAACSFILPSLLSACSKVNWLDGVAQSAVGT